VPWLRRRGARVEGGWSDEGVVGRPYACIPGLKRGAATRKTGRLARFADMGGTERRESKPALSLTKWSSDGPRERPVDGEPLAIPGI
jgi:hypothetical protein